MLARDPDRARVLVPDAAGYIAYRQGENGDGEAVLADAHHVVNLAGASLFKPFTGRRRLRKVARQLVEGARQLVTAIHRALDGPRILINASSAGVYGFGTPTDEPADETTTPLPRSTRRIAPAGGRRAR